MEKNTIPLSYHFNALKIAAVIGFLFGLAACASNSNQTERYPHFINAEKMHAAASKTVVISPYNLGLPSKSYLKSSETKIDVEVIKQLRAEGFDIADDSVLQSAWRNAIRKFGQPYDQSSGHRNENTLSRIMQFVIKQLKDQGEIDAIVFTDLIERKVTINRNRNNSARWDGKTQRLGIRGSGQVDENFDWSQNIPAASLMVVVYSIEGEVLFKGVGGVGLTRIIDSNKSTKRFVKKSSPLFRNDDVKEGVALALYPIGGED